MNTTDTVHSTAKTMEQLVSLVKLLIVASALILVCSIHMDTSNGSSYLRSLSLSIEEKTMAVSGNIGATNATVVPRQTACTEDAAGMMYILDGEEVTSKQLWNTLHSHLPIPKLHAIQVQGSCGGFGGTSDSMTIFLRAGSTDIPVFYEIWIKNEFAFLDQLFAQQGIVPKRIMDLGMNCGLASLYFTTQFPEAQIVALEPGLESYAVASLNLAHKPRVFLEYGAVVGHGGSFSQLLVRKGRHWAMGVGPVSLSEMTANASVGAYSISYLMSKYGWESIDYMKIDIEGSEKNICDSILQGMAPWIWSVGCITFEYHDRYAKGATTSCNSAMKASGFNHMGIEGELTVWCKP